MDSGKPFRFLDLPAELRSMIHQHRFSSDDVIVIRDYPAPAPALLLASKQIYSEGIKIFYQSTTFYVDHFKDTSMFKSIQPRLRDSITCIRTLNGPWSAPAPNTSRALECFRMFAKRHGFTLREEVIQVAQRVPENGVIWVNAFGKVEEGTAWESEMCQRSWASEVIEKREVRES